MVLIGALIVLCVGSGASQHVTLTEPVTLNIPAYELRYFSVSLVPDQWQVHVVLWPIGADTDLHAVRHTWADEEGETLIKQLNSADFSSVSLKTRLLQRLVDDGVLAGTVEP